MTRSERSGSKGLQIEWTQAADSDLESIAAYIAQDKPKAAAAIILKIIRLVEDLLPLSPAMGRPGRVPRTRELVIPNTPYIVVYRIQKNNLEILRVIHGSRSWPRPNE